MQRVWDFLNKFRDKYELTLQYYQNVNRELDRYLEELTQLEFNFNIIEMQQFVTSLQNTNSEFERKLILNNEIKRNNIELPFDANDDNSLSGWLNSL
ncbi:MULTISPECIES: hypothetical protein [Morganellaceae]|uniref:hypothetical protein n=1 Tax=Morganellaceae TaxID=1903414 RepID=UPI001E386711|nr:hypothetical protein [Proteus terrae]MCW9690459.1 hypothetical protein [Proteus terrae]